MPNYDLAHPPSAHLVYSQHAQPSDWLCKCDKCERSYRIAGDAKKCDRGSPKGTFFGGTIDGWRRVWKKAEGVAPGRDNTGNDGRKGATRQNPAGKGKGKGNNGKNTEPGYHPDLAIRQAKEIEDLLRKLAAAKQAPAEEVKNDTTPVGADMADAKKKSLLMEKLHNAKKWAAEGDDESAANAARYQRELDAMAATALAAEPPAQKVARATKGVKEAQANIEWVTAQNSKLQEDLLGIQEKIRLGGIALQEANDGGVAAKLLLADATKELPLSHQGGCLGSAANEVTEEELATMGVDRAGYLKVVAGLNAKFFPPPTPTPPASPEMAPAEASRDVPMAPPARSESGEKRQSEFMSAEAFCQWMEGEPSSGFDTVRMRTLIDGAKRARVLRQHEDGPLSAAPSTPMEIQTAAPPTPVY